MRPGRIPLFALALSLPLAVALPAAATATAPARPAPTRPAMPAAPQAPVEPAAEPALSPAVIAAVQAQARGAIKRFYAGRGFRPLWVSGDRIGPQGAALLRIIETAEADGLRPARYRPAPLRQALAEAGSGDPRLVARAELRLSATFARLVGDLRKPRDTGMTYADPALRPPRLSAEAVLRAAAFPRPFADYVATMGWMSPHYARLREAMHLARQQGAAPALIARIARNLDRARLLPGPWTRHVLVDAASGRLWYYEAGREAGTMKVVVGTPQTPTPMLAGQLQWAILNPYWNVPMSLARTNIAPKILSGRSLSAMKIEALADWSATPRALKQSEVDWAAVAAGQAEVRLRELPGPHNSMGKVKLLFPNDQGIYLHDTPARDLFKAADRHFSNGCIRLEDAARLSRWLLHRPLPARGTAPEQAVPLPVQVPVYISYLTASASEAGLALHADAYGLDGGR